MQPVVGCAVAPRPPQWVRDGKRNGEEKDYFNIFQMSWKEGFTFLTLSSRGKRGFKICHVYFSAHHWGRTASIAIERPTNRAVTAKWLQRLSKLMNQRSIIIFFISFFKCHQISGKTDLDSHISGGWSLKTPFLSLKFGKYGGFPGP